MEWSHYKQITLLEVTCRIIAPSMKIKIEEIAWQSISGGIKISSTIICAVARKV